MCPEALFEIANEDALAEAAYWAAVYRNNPRERVYGIDRLDDAVETSLAEHLGDTAISASEQRAAGFTIIPLAGHETGAECARFLRTGSENGQRGDGSRRGRGGPRQDGGQGGGPGGGRGSCVFVRYFSVDLRRALWAALRSRSRWSARRARR